VHWYYRSDYVRLGICLPPNADDFDLKMIYVNYTFWKTYQFIETIWIWHWKWDFPYNTHTHICLIKFDFVKSHGGKNLYLPWFTMVEIPNVIFKLFLWIDKFSRTCNLHILIKTFTANYWVCEQLHAYGKCLYLV
jgi:hypothetical protein